MIPLRYRIEQTIQELFIGAEVVVSDDCFSCLIHLSDNEITYKDLRRLSRALGTKELSFSGEIGQFFAEGTITAEGINLTDTREYPIPQKFP